MFFQKLEEIKNELFPQEPEEDITLELENFDRDGRFAEETPHKQSTGILFSKSNIIILYLILM